MKSEEVFEKFCRPPRKGDEKLAPPPPPPEVHQVFNYCYYFDLRVYSLTVRGKRVVAFSGFWFRPFEDSSRDRTMSGVELSFNNADYKAGLHWSEIKGSIRKLLKRDIARRDLGIWIKKKVQKDQRPRLFRILKDIVVYIFLLLCCKCSPES